MKRKFVAGTCIVLVLGLAGCGNAIPKMTEEQENQIVNYAVDVALKYDSGYEKNLVDLSLYEEEEKESITEPEKEKDEKEEEKGMDPVADTPTVDISQDETAYSSMEEFFGLENVSIQFKEGYFADSYPQGSINDYFNLNASSGKKLLVMKFEVANTSGTEQQVDFFGMNAVMTVSLNAKSNVQVLSTMLTDDLSTFRKSMNADEKAALVLLAEVEAEDATDVDSLIITMKSDSGSAKISLK